MHVLTKIFVVFASFLSVLLVALTVAYASNSGELVSQVKALKDQCNTLSAQRALDNADRDKELREREMQRDEQAKLVREREAEILQLKTQIADISRSLAMIKLEKEQVDAKLTQLIATSSTQADLLDRLTEEVNRRREEGLALERRNIELQDEINDLNSQLDVAHAHESKLEEQVKSLSDQLAGNVEQTSGENIPPVQVFGRIVSVETTRTGEIYVEVNLGSSDQLRKGHELRIVRGDEYIGTLSLQKVDVNRSVGKVVRLRRGMDVQVNDSVQSPMTQ